MCGRLLLVEDPVGVGVIGVVAGLETLWVSPSTKLGARVCVHIAGLM